MILGTASRILLLTLLLCGATKSLGQNCSLDSLRLEVDSKRNQGAEVHLSTLSRYANLCMETDLPRALRAAREQLEIAQNQGHKTFEADANETIGRILYMQGSNDSAELHLRRAVELFDQLPNSESRAIEANSYLANVYRVVSKFDSALEIYYKALDYYLRMGDRVWEAKILANIGSLYYNAGNQKKGKDFTLRALKLQQSNGDTQGEAISLINLMVFAINDNDYKEGIRYGEEALKKLKSINITYYAAALLRVGYCHYMLGQHDKALDLTREAIRIYEENQSGVGQLEGLRTLADYYMDMKQYRNAKRVGLEALSIADTTNRLDMRLLYDLLKRASIYLNHHEDALMYSSMQLKLKEQDMSRDWADKIAEVEAKYQTAKKDKEIQLLMAQKRFDRGMIWFLFALLASLGSGAFILMSNLKQKNLLAQQQVIQLQKEKQLVATHALLEGENSERIRLSKDLHDGLGGLLMVTKQKISGMKGNLTIPEEQVHNFNSAIDMLDRSISELRRVAHNLMPESLVRFGLVPAIADICASIEVAHFNFYGVEVRMNEKIEVATFRIASELINNALKHSNASKINVQLVQEVDRVCLTVHDNGKGFDAIYQKQKSTGGLRNVNSRVTALNGKWDVLSDSERGTEVTVEFAIR